MLDTDDGRGLEYFDEEITNDARIALTWQSPGGRKRERPKDIYEEKEGREGAKPVWLEELGESAQVARKRAEWRNFVSVLCDTWRKKEQC